MEFFNYLFNFGERTFAGEDDALRARMLNVPSPKYTASAPASIAACRQVKSPAGASISGFFIDFR